MREYLLKGNQPAGLKCKQPIRLGVASLRDRLARLIVVLSLISALSVPFGSFVALFLQERPSQWSSPCEASSLWDEGTPSLFEDHKARRVGDLVTVLIVERSYASNKATTNTGKTVGGTVAEGGGLLSFIPGLGFDAKTKFSGGNTTSRMGSLVAKMSARVIEVLPNGNLKIQGKQGLIINKERQDILITGIVRPQDIRADNTVLSTYVGDAEIRYEGNLSSDQRKGILGFLQRFFAGVLDILF